MRQKIINAVMFTAGAAIGSLVTWKVVKTKYERIIQEEIDSFKETYAECMGRNARATKGCANEWDDFEEEDDDDEDDDGDIVDYNRLSSIYRGTGEETENDGEGGEGDDIPYINGPYVISPDDFADGNYDFDCYSLTYYKDGILADDWGVKMDIEDTIGEEALDHFDDYAEDIVHVRNERNRADYEVARDPRNYADVLNDNPLMRMYAN